MPGIGSGDAPERQDSTVAQLIENMRLCFLREDMPDASPNFAFGWGRLYIRELCCSGTIISGIDLQVAPRGGDGEWEGDTKLAFSLQDMYTKCQAKWKWVPDRWMPFDRTHSGDVSMHLANTRSTPSRFVDFVLRFAGRPITADGSTYAFLGNTSVLGCSTNFEVRHLSFGGFGARLLNLTGGLAPEVEDLLRPLFCMEVTSRMPEAINSRLVTAHAAVSELLSHVAPPLGVPAPPSGAGPAADLRWSQPLAFAGRLLEQGFATGELSKLIGRATAGTGAATLRLLGRGWRLFDGGIERPTDLKLGIFLEGGGVEGMHTIDSAGMSVFNSSGLSMSLAQEQLAISASFRAEAAIPGGGGAGVDAADAVRQLVETLTERFSMRLALSRLDVAARLGLLVDERQLGYLSGGQGWYSRDCLTSMVQNISAMEIDVKVVVEEFKWVSMFRNPGVLEVQIDQCLNNLLTYLNAPGMRPTVTRLVQSVAAGQVRDVVNGELATWLAAPPERPCDPVFGTGSPTAYAALAAVGGCAALVAACCLVWGHLRQKLEGRDYALLLSAAAAACFALGGMLGRPFRAAFRMHDGGVDDPLAGESVAYMFIPVLGDVLRYMPTVVILAALLALFGIARVILLVVGVKSGFKPFVASCIRWSAAVGAWDLIVAYIIAGTQVVSFYALMLKFGDSFVDMGIQINPGFYLHVLGIYLCDVGTLLVHHRCQQPRVLPPMLAELASGRRLLLRPRHGALAGLALALALLLAAPWLRLWTLTHSGLVGKAVHFQSGSAHQVVTLAGIISQQELLNPGPLDVKALLMRLFLAVHVVIAPIVHAGLALYVGLRLRLGRADEAPQRTIASTSPAPEDGTGHRHFWLNRRLLLALVWARLWSGADAFAATMCVVVPELGAEVTMATKQACDQLAAMLDRAGDECYVVSSTLDASGLAVLFAGGLLARVCAELYTHGPLRRLNADHTPCGQHLDLIGPAHS